MMEKKVQRRTSLTKRIVHTGVWGLVLLQIARKLYQEYNRVDLRGKVILITGGSRGLGLALARALATKGAKLVLCARNGDQLAKAKHELEVMGCQVLTIKADLRDQAQVNHMVSESLAYFGRVDILINNAGVMIVGPENVMDVEDYKNVMDANLWSALYAVKSIMPHFRTQGKGHIVNICSIGGKISVPHMLPYSVSKFALVGLSQGLASEVAKDRVTVTTVIPNLMRTGSPRNISVKGNHQAEYAWFKLSDSLPLISQSAAAAAADIVDAIERKRSEVTLTYTAKVATTVQGLFPGIVSAVAQLAGRLLPGSDDRTQKKGYESESSATRGVLGGITDKAAGDYNQL